MTTSRPHRPAVPLRGPVPDADEVAAAIRAPLNGDYILGSLVGRFEEAFTKYVGGLRRSG